MGVIIEFPGTRHVPPKNTPITSGVRENRLYRAKEFVEAAAATLGEIVPYESHRNHEDMNTMYRSLQSLADRIETMVKEPF